MAMHKLAGVKTAMNCRVITWKTYPIRFAICKLMMDRVGDYVRSATWERVGLRVTDASWLRRIHGKQ